MKKIAIAILLTATTNIAFISTVAAAEATRAWGASSNVGTQLVSSAGYHQVAGQSAQIIATGGDSRSVNKTSTSCGICIYNTNTGDNNSIQGNTSTSTNTGSVTSNANFNDTALVSTNTPASTTVANQ